MKIITWNCKKYFNSKVKLVLADKPDILIVPECDNPEVFAYDSDALKPSNSIWYGAQGADRGIGVFSYGEYKIELLEIHNSSIKYVLPIAVSHNEFNFILLAVWTHEPYTKQIWDGIKYYSALLEGDIIIAGDFNSNSQWDNKNKNNSHSDLVKHLAGKNIFSAYHHFKKESQGSETTPTFHWYHHENKPFHIDYCFASLHFIERLQNVEVGTFKDWAKHSDHMPLTFTFDFTNSDSIRSLS